MTISAEAPEAKIIDAWGKHRRTWLGKPTRNLGFCFGEFYMGGSKNRGKTPKWMVKIMEKPIKKDDLGGLPLFLETSIIYTQQTGENTNPTNDGDESFWLRKFTEYRRDFSYGEAGDSTSLNPKFSQNIPISSHIIVLFYNFTCRYITVRMFWVYKVRSSPH